MASASHNSKGRAYSVSLKSSTSGYPTPPASASPTKSSFHRNSPSPPSQLGIKYENESSDNTKSRRRCSSLCERFPGDMSHRPLDQLRKETKAANRAPHLKKKHIPGADTIDSLDRSAFGLSYHHGGPYDATLLARNRTRRHAPVEALKSSNNEALKATPREFIKASLERHIPLQGTAVIPPGLPGMDGRIMKYEEGADLMRESDAPGGAYKRWPDMKYLPDDLKGKGEPSYSIEKALKKDKIRRAISGGVTSYEMIPLTSSVHNQRNSDGMIRNNFDAGSLWNSTTHFDRYGSRRRGLSTGQRVGEGLKRRFESLARGRKTAGAQC